MKLKSVIIFAIAVLLSCLIVSKSFQIIITYGEERRAEACIENLISIDSAKQQWAHEFHKELDAAPTWDDLHPYLYDSFLENSNKPPHCPEGGIYTIGPVGGLVTCSFPGHDIRSAPVVKHVVDELGRAISKAVVVVSDVSGRQVSSETDGNGNCTIKMWPRLAVYMIISKSGYYPYSNSLPAFPEIVLKKANVASGR